MGKKAADGRRERNSSSQFERSAGAMVVNTNRQAEERLRACLVYLDLSDFLADFLELVLQTADKLESRSLLLNMSHVVRFRSTEARNSDAAAHDTDNLCTVTTVTNGKRCSDSAVTRGRGSCGQVAPAPAFWR